MHLIQSSTSRFSDAADRANTAVADLIDAADRDGVDLWWFDEAGAWLCTFIVRLFGL